MRRGKSDSNMFASLPKQRSIQILIFVGFLYILLLITLELPLVLKHGIFSIVPEDHFNGFPSDAFNNRQLESEEYLDEKNSPNRPKKNNLFRNSSQPSSSLSKQLTGEKFVSGLVFDSMSFNSSSNDGIQKTAHVAWEIGRKVWEELESGNFSFIREMKAKKNQSESCPHSISLSGTEFLERGKIVVIPCGLTLGSHVTVVGKPRIAHAETEPKIALVRDGEQVMVSQFMMELQGLKTVEGEDPPRVLHFNPRLKGDWSGKPVIEQNTCYRMQWGAALRCEGWKSKADEETVDGQVKCDKWIRDDDDRSEESKATWWLNRLIGRTKKVTVDWPYPFAEDKLFILTLSAGFEGYHVTVDGRHVTSFPYRTGFALEDATGLSLNGDVDVHSVFAVSLPTSHPSYAPQRHLEMSNRWKAPPLPDGPVELFIGILSAGNHFTERMAVRKSWMQHKLVKSSSVVARFFVALHARKEVNAELKKEADFFGDVVIVPYMDNYDLVVLKTVAICEYGVRTLSAEYIMKCDDDTFVRVDAVMNEAKKVPIGRSLYVGNINYYHKPLRHGKWAVTYEIGRSILTRRSILLAKLPSYMNSGTRLRSFGRVRVTLELAKLPSYMEWPEEDYPPYANGPGYILSSDIAQFIVSQFEKHKLRLFKMEDVSMGMWVEQFNSSNLVEYIHSPKFCQFGCIDDYYSAHYQSPRQMICMWNKLQQKGRPECCNMR